MTLEQAEQELRTLADDLYAESLIHDEHVEQLRRIADFLASLKEKREIS